jgi:NAD(P)-dependent dehydrogenase (short-subunit alcohol dehydrogenase family)
MSKPWILISPSSRGIGLALTRSLLQRTAPSIPILATTRAKNPDETKDKILSELSNSSSANDRLHLVRLDVTDESTISAAAEKAEQLFPSTDHHLRLAFAIPGILRPEKSVKQVDAADALETFKVNALGPLLLMKWFGEFLPRKKTNLEPGTHGDGATAGSSEDGQGLLQLPPHATWLAMSARVGSTSDNKLGGWYSYRASKAGVHSLAKSFDIQLKSRSGDKAMAMAYHPGTVKTELSKEFWSSVGEDRMFSPEDAANRMLEVVMGEDKIGTEGRGKCWDWKGTEVPP